ncbi:homoserine/homoserine lactone efflux protein [Halomonas elongata]|uniref:Homoserine/homoserine lactone efflux protein n=1 Tax=Halomonas elongata TaxID=2746 RepID=A0A1B8P3B0_HALEL|nr:homoserine/homoserine lactone efflux protein [Halomonas elongata]
MLTYSLAHWMTFLSAAVLLNLSPGPDMAFILGQTARHGRRGGVAAMFGVWSGAALHVGMAALGLSAVLATSALAFSLVKWIGAAYLVWLGLQILLRRGAEAASSVSVPSTPRSGPSSVRASWCRRSTPRWRYSSWPFCPSSWCRGRSRRPATGPARRPDHPGGGSDRAAAGVPRRSAGACHERPSAARRLAGEGAGGPVCAVGGEVGAERALGGNADLLLRSISWLLAVLNILIYWRVNSGISVPAAANLSSLAT